MTQTVSRAETSKYCAKQPQMTAHVRTGHLNMKGEKQVVHAAKYCNDWFN